MEAAGLGLFMISACVFAVLLEHPASPLRQALDDGLLRRAADRPRHGADRHRHHLLALGQAVRRPSQSGGDAHLPGAWARSRRWDAAFYVLAQFAGALAGVGWRRCCWARRCCPMRRSISSPRFPARRAPGSASAPSSRFPPGSCWRCSVFSNSRELNRYTGLAAGALVALYITVEAPLSGMSMNPARTFGSALPAQLWQAVWIYFTAPPLGMLLAAALYLRRRRRRRRAVLQAAS